MKSRYGAGIMAIETDYGSAIASTANRCPGVRYLCRASASIYDLYGLIESLSQVPDAVAGFHKDHGLFES
jgi:hypothetical protein